MSPSHYIPFVVLYFSKFEKVIIKKKCTISLRKLYFPDQYMTYKALKFYIVRVLCRNKVTQGCLTQSVKTQLSPKRPHFC